MQLKRGKQKNLEFGSCLQDTNNGTWQFILDVNKSIADKKFKIINEFFKIMFWYRPLSLYVCSSICYIGQILFGVYINKKNPDICKLTLFPC